MVKLLSILFESKVLDVKGRRYSAYFYGDDSGEWEYLSSPILGFRKSGYTWEMVSSLSSRNEWRNFSVDGATEYNIGFIKALKGIAAEYPEVLDFVISFDGPWKSIKEILNEHDIEQGGVGRKNFSDVVFYHGTSLENLEKIMHEGLKPRMMTGLESVYGAKQAGESDLRYVYLTTQLGMAHYAALSSAARYRSIPIVLKVTGLSDGSLFYADEDSHENNAIDSLKRIGSVAYQGIVPANKIKIFEKLVDGEWKRVSL
jgi:hypothetical protein